MNYPFNIIPIFTLVLGLYSSIALGEDGMPPATKDGKYCVTKEAMSVGMATATTVNVFAILGYCSEKFPTDKPAYNNCVAINMPLMISGMVTNKLATETQIDQAIKEGLTSGKRLFHEGTGWIQDKTTGAR